MNFEPAGRIHRTKRNGEEFACATIIETHEEKEHRQECLCHYWPGSGGMRIPAGESSQAGGGRVHSMGLKRPVPLDDRTETTDQPARFTWIEIPQKQTYMSEEMLSH